MSYKPLEKMLKAAGMTKLKLRTEYHININSLNRYIREGQHNTMIDSMCRILNCQVSDIVEYVPDDPVKDDPETDTSHIEE